MHEFLEGLLRHKSDMVNIEAARAICDMKNVTAQELVRPVAGESPNVAPDEYS
jgi:coatomer protein complex subunit gamma